MTKRSQLVPADASILRRLQQGDPDAAQQVFATYAPELLSAAERRLAVVLNSRVDAEDIVQSTFKSFFRRASTGGYAAPKSGDLFNLLIVIAMRKINAKVKHHFAQHRDVRRTASSDQSGVEPVGLSNEEALRELCLTIDEILVGYSDVQRQIVIGRLEGYSVQEIAHRCQRSLRTVERELQAFRVKLCSEFDP